MSLSLSPSLSLYLFQPTFLADPLFLFLIFCLFLFLLLPSLPSFLLTLSLALSLLSFSCSHSLFLSCPLLLSFSLTLLPPLFLVWPLSFYCNLSLLSFLSLTQSSSLTHSFSLFLSLFPFHFCYIGIHSLQGWAATTSHIVTRKRSIKRLKHTGNVYKWPRVKRCLLLLDLKPFRS